MARTTVLKIMDDLTGQAVDDDDWEAVEFTVDGVDYRLDLSNKSALLFRETLDQFVEKAERIGGRKKRGLGAPAAPVAKTPEAEDRKRDVANIRAWAIEQDYEIGVKGRIPEAIEVAYWLAHKPAKGKKAT